MENKQRALQAYRYFYNALVDLENAYTRKKQAENQIVALQNQLMEARAEAQRLTAKGTFTKKSIQFVLTAIVIVFWILVIFLPAAFGGRISFSVSYISSIIITLLLARGVGFLLSKKKTFADDMLSRAYTTSVPVCENNLKNAILAMPEIDFNLAVASAVAKPMLEAFPPKYGFSYAVGKVIEYIENLRADSLKEALNLFETEEWQNNMLNESRKQTAILQESLEVQKQMLGELKEIKSYAKQAADYLGDIATTNRLIADNTARIAAYSSYIAGKVAEATGESKHF